MTRMMVWTGLAALAFGGIALSALPAQAPAADPAPGEPAKICKSVVSAERGATPLQDVSDEGRVGGEEDRGCQGRDPLGLPL